MVLNTKSSAGVPTLGYARRVLIENPHFSTNDIINMMIGTKRAKLRTAKGRHLRLKAFRRDGAISVFTLKKYEVPVFCGVRMVTFSGGYFFAKVVPGHKMAVLNRPLFG